MTGDGQSDIVRIRKGEVCYWPNRGYGRFGAKITMDHAPWFDEPDLFDRTPRASRRHRRSGTADILYLGRDGVAIFSIRPATAGAPRSHRPGSQSSTTSASVADLLGNGTACLVWSSPLPREPGVRCAMST